MILRLQILRLILFTVPLFLLFNFSSQLIVEKHGTQVSLHANDILESNLAEPSSTLLVSTIDGYLTAVDAQTGIDKWRFKEGPLIESPVNVQRGFTFIPDPRDGQLYLIVEGHLSKLPFTIPHLVRVSPCKSSEGVFYAGSKKDVWISLNPETGERVHTFESSTSPPAFCPASHSRAVHIGKTEYQIQMLDTKRRDRQWNATFVDYSSHLLPEELDYSLQHFTSSADGRVLTVDERSGFVLWQRDFGQVIVNMYLLKGDGMHRLPSTAIGQETFELLSQSTALNPLLHAPSQLPDRLLPTLYIGESPHVGLYALPAYVDERTHRIAPKYVGPPLLEGPKSNKDAISKNLPEQIERRQIPPENSVGLGSTYTTSEGEFIVLGYHEVPKAMQSVTGMLPLGPDPSQDSMSANTPLIGYNQPKKGGKAERKADVVNTAHRILLPTNTQFQHPQHESDTFEGFLIEILDIGQRYPYRTGTIIVLIIAMLIVFWLRGHRRQSIFSRQQTRTESIGSTQTAIGTEHTRSSYGSVYGANDLDDLPVGVHRIGSTLKYDTSKLLGQGCDGTMVFKGQFDGRDVAVKRILFDQHVHNEVRKLIEREVDHLRQSDSHPNVVRYFCSESDKIFHYLALELCDMTLDTYIQQNAGQLQQADKLDLMKQIVEGIAHLHRINIVHRDVKPKNILLNGIKSNTDPDSSQPRVKISDFGLCKSVKFGHNSISKVSGVVGTEGWMAPELYSHSISTVSYAVDVFSMGCVFYYVLTDGQHPFGGPITRMNNIIKGDYSLDLLDENVEYNSRCLIEAMIRSDPKLRPTSNVVFLHPAFWSAEKQLQFIIEVSARIETKEEKNKEERELLRRLGGWRARTVLRNNWQNNVHEELLKALQTRSYGNNVRDLIRAIRNKRIHYTESPPKLKALLGSLPDGFLKYFTSRFPKLLMHVYMATACVGNENVFKQFYTPYRELNEFCELELRILNKQGPDNWRSDNSPENWRAGANKTSTLRTTSPAIPPHQTVRASPLLINTTQPTSLFETTFNPNITHQLLPVAAASLSPSNQITTTTSTATDDLLIEKTINAEEQLIQDSIDISHSTLNATGDKPSPSRNFTLTDSTTIHLKTVKPKKPKKKKKKASLSILLSSQENGEENEAMDEDKIEREKEKEQNCDGDDDDDVDEQLENEENGL